MDDLEQAPGLPKEGWLDQHWVSLCVELDAPIPVLGESEPANGASLIVGYFLNLGVTATSDAEARDIAQQGIADGVVDWSDSTIDRVDV